MLETDANALYTLDYDLIYSHINKAGTAIKSVAQFIEMTPDGLGRALKNQTLSVKSLEKIAEFFNVHPGEFFTGHYKAEETALLLEITFLKSIIVEKDLRLKEKDDYIKLLKEKHK